MKEFEEIERLAKLQEADLLYGFSRIVEGGHRRHIPQSTRDKFIHAVLIIPEPADRQSEIDSIFAELAEKNQEAYFKAHPELKKEQDSNEELKESEEDFDVRKVPTHEMKDESVEKLKKRLHYWKDEARKEGHRFDFCESVCKNLLRYIKNQEPASYTHSRQFKYI
jgi:hypothetical protein